jgi:hypothetical protein
MLPPQKHALTITPVSEDPCTVRFGVLFFCWWSSRLSLPRWTDDERDVRVAQECEDGGACVECVEGGDCHSRGACFTLCVPCDFCRDILLVRVCGGKEGG